MNRNPELKKAVFPVAGLGTRFLPATKANPKEMLPIVDKPLIQYAVDEAVSAGFNELIFITNSTKRSIEDHFDLNFELEARLRATQKHDLLKIVTDVLPKGVSCAYLRQPEPRGLGHAVLCAAKAVGNVPFAVILADDLIHAPKSCLAQMREAYHETQSSIIAVEKISDEDCEKYGVVGFENEWQALKKISRIVEKPKPEAAPSRFGVVGRYILTPEIFDMLQTNAERHPNDGKEIQITDAIAALMSMQSVYAYEFSGKRHDCGSKMGYLKATVETALMHEDLGQSFHAYLETLMRASSSI